MSATVIDIISFCITNTPIFIISEKNTIHINKLYIVLIFKTTSVLIRYRIVIIDAWVQVFIVQFMNTLSLPLLFSYIIILCVIYYCIYYCLCPPWTNTFFTTCEVCIYSYSDCEIFRTPIFNQKNIVLVIIQLLLLWGLLNF